MVNKALPGDIEDPGRIDATRPIESGGKEGLGKDTSSSSSFSALMKPNATSSPLATGGVVSPFDLIGGPHPVATMPTLGTLIAQANQAQTTLGDINNQLNSPKLKLKASTKYLVKTKLSDANDNLRALNGNLGTEPPPEVDHSKFSGPLGKFLAYVKEGQDQMNAAQEQLKSLKDKGASLSAGDFLLVQIKMNKAQQLLEFTSVLLSSAVSGAKLLMQTQL